MRKLTIRNQEYYEEEKPVQFFVEKMLNAEPPSCEDFEERIYLQRLLDKYCTLYMDDDLFTRRVALQPKYDNDENLASCMSMIQFIIRDNTVYCYCTMRSEINTTHNWDCDTLFILTEYVQKRYNIQNKQIYMTVNSYHQRA